MLSSPLLLSSPTLHDKSNVQLYITQSSSVIASSRLLADPSMSHTTDDRTKGGGCGGVFFVVAGFATTKSIWKGALQSMHGHIIGLHGQAKGAELISLI